MSILRIKLLRDGAKMPTRGTPVAAGLDLYACFASGQTKAIIGCGERRLIPCGISVAFPPNFYARIAPRSGLAWKHYIDTCAGVVDSDYRGEIFVMLHNHHLNEHYVVENGMRVGQMIMEQCWIGDPTLVDDLDDTTRGEQGFGSTGL